MSQRISHLEESQHKMHTSLGLVNPEPTVYPPLPPPAVEILGLGTTTMMMVMMMMTSMRPMMKTKKSPSEDLAFPSLILVLDAKVGEVLSN
jgi:hypothetical protein